MQTKQSWQAGRRSRLFLVGLCAPTWLTTASLAQTGFVSSVNGLVQARTGEPATAGLRAEPQRLQVGSYLHELPLTVTTGAGSQAMMFFTGGLDGDTVEFLGAVVVIVDESTQLTISPGRGRRNPIEFTVEGGRAKVYFDGRDQREHVLVGTPLAQLKVTGSVLWAAHDALGNVSRLAVEDSDAVATHARTKAQKDLTSGQTISASAEALSEPGPLTEAESASWHVPDLGLVSALAQRGFVREWSASRIYNVLESEATGVAAAIIQRREPVLNVPSQVAVLQVTTESAILALSSRLTQGSFGEAAGLIGSAGAAPRSEPTASRTPKVVGRLP